MSGHRYRLTRTGLGGDAVVSFVMLNPSTADDTEDDPTIRRCIGFAKREGAGELRVANLFSERATNPNDLTRLAFPGQVADEQIDALCWALEEADLVLAAWGASLAALVDARLDAIGRRWLSRRANAPILCLGLTKHGRPRHPLYVREDAPLEPFFLGLGERRSDQ